MGKTDSSNSRTLEDIYQLLVELKHEIVTLKTEVLLTRYGVEQTEKKIEKIEVDLEMERANSIMAQPGPNMRIEKF